MLHVVEKTHKLAMVESMHEHLLHAHADGVREARQGRVRPRRGPRSPKPSERSWQRIPTSASRPKFVPGSNSDIEALGGREAAEGEARRSRGGAAAPHMKASPTRAAKPRFATANPVGTSGAWD